MTFTLYSKDNCPYCQKLKHLFDLTEQKCMVYNLDVDFTKDQFYDEFGVGSTFPQVTTEKSKIGGCNDTIKFLREQKIL